MPFQSILQDSTPFHNIPPRSMAFHSVKKSSIPFQTDDEHSSSSVYIWFQSISPTLYYIPDHVTVFCGDPFNQRAPHLRRDHSGTLYCVTLHVLHHQIHKIALNSTKLHHVLEHSILSKEYPFISKKISNSLLCHSLPHSTPFHNVFLHSPIFQHIPLLYILAWRHHFHPNRTGDIYYVTLQPIPLKFTTLPSIPRHSIAFHRVAFCNRRLHSFTKESEAVC